MKLMESSKLIGVSVMLFVGLAACDKPGPAENAGRKLDQTVDQAGNKMSNMADNIGDKMERQSEKTGMAIDDAAITTKVKAAIFAESSLKSLEISVYTVGGVVTLSGSASSSRPLRVAAPAPL